MIDFSLNQLYRTAGVSKQSVHQARRRQASFERKLDGLILDLEDLRLDHPGCGLQKAYYTLRPDFLGRDRFIDLFQGLGYHIRRRKVPRPRTTIPGKLRFKDLIEGHQFNAANQVWQSDLTYYPVDGDFCYIVFLIDIYSKVIVGHQVSDHMRKEANLRALKTALRKYGAPWIHHSDRGSQYTSHAYLDLLKEHEVQASMAGMAQQNAFAERINKTIKEEFLDYRPIKTLADLKTHTAQAVEYYNNKRPHDHLNRMTPISFLEEYQQLEVNKRPIVKIPKFNF